MVKGHLKIEIRRMLRKVLGKELSQNPCGQLPIGKMWRKGGELLGKSLIAILKIRETKGETSAQ